MVHRSIIVIGAGPAGLAAGYELLRHGVQPILLEKENRVGGLARNQEYKGYRFHVGGYRLTSESEEVKELWSRLLGADLLRQRRLSRIYYRGQFFQIPLDITQAMSKLGLWESWLVLLSYLRWQLLPYQDDLSVERWMTNRLGARLYKRFYLPYARKVLGEPGQVFWTERNSGQAKYSSLTSWLSHSFSHKNGTEPFGDELFYPRQGPGMIWERMCTILDGGYGNVNLESEVLGVNHDGDRIRSVIVRHAGHEREMTAWKFISSMPLADLITRMRPRPPEDVVSAAQSLKFRDLLMVYVILDQAEVFPDHWIYVHNPDVRVGRIQNYKNWSLDTVPDPGRTSLGLEYFCNMEEALWSLSDQELITLAKKELSQLGLVSADKVKDATVVRQARAYPLTDRAHCRHLQIVQAYLSRFRNLQSIGRKGLHGSYAPDQSMLTGLLAVRSFFGEPRNHWSIDRSESFIDEIMPAPSF